MDAHKLLENIEARGGVATVKRDDGAAVLNVSPRSLALELLPDLQKFKPALLELLGAVAAGAVAASAPALAMPDDVPLNANEAAAAILGASYFNLARGGVWCIGWQQPSRSAFRFACVATGGKLLGTNRVPDMDASAAISWAKAQQENEVAA